MANLPCSGVRRANSVYGSASRLILAGVLVHKNASGKVISRKKIYANHEVIIGRDRTRCQYVFNDPHVSKKHLRIYTVVYENDEPNEIDTLVYAEDLSQNGTYWNAALIGKGNGGFLLSEGDVLRLSRNTHLQFSGPANPPNKSTFDLTQEFEMARFRHEYVVTDRLLGAGAFGKVFMAIEQNARSQVACKMVDLRKLIPKATNRFGHPEEPATAEDVDSSVQMRKLRDWIDQQKREKGMEEKLQLYFREVEILTTINHVCGTPKLFPHADSKQPNIIGIEKVFITDNTLYMMQNLVTAGDLFSYIESKNGKLLEAEAAVVIRQILIALAFLHEKNIVHRDIKPDNILMTSLSAGCRVVLTDFGAARRVPSQRHRMSTLVGTHEYAAPEMLYATRKHRDHGINGYTRAVDMWALGCVCVILLTGGLAFSDPVTGCYSEALASDCDLAFLQKSKDWQRVRTRPRAFVENLLVLDEEARMTAEEALAHSWFSNQIHRTDFEELYQRTIKNWHARPAKASIVNFQDRGSIRYLSCSQHYIDKYNNKGLTTKARGPTPIEAPYKPFPRNMHLSLWPKRDAKDRLSDEVLSAIENNWGAQAEPDLVRKARMNYVSNARGSPTFEDEERRTRRATTPVKAIREPIVSRSFLRLPRTQIPLRLHRDKSRQEPAFSNTGLKTRLNERFGEDEPLQSVVSCTQNIEQDTERYGSKGPKAANGTPDTKKSHRKDRTDNVKAEPANREEIFNLLEGHDEGDSMEVDIAATSDLSKDPAKSAAAPTTPVIKRSLKRRQSTTNLTANVKRKRRPGSIYDLSDDSDSDSDNDELERRPVFIFQHQVNTFAGSHANSKPLYLPR